MENLPEDISLNIFSRLPASSIIQCKKVCKAWLRIAQHPDLAELHLTYHQSHSNPSLILHHSGSNRDSLYLVKDCLYGDNNNNSEDCKQDIKHIDMPNYMKFRMDKFTSVLSCNGLLCLYSSEERYYDPRDNQACIYNPVTGDFTFLPFSELPSKRGYKAAFAFGFHPSSKEYKVVRIIHRKSEGLDTEGQDQQVHQKIEVFTLGSRYWRTIHQVPLCCCFRGIPFLFLVETYSPSINGSLHWLAKSILDSSQVIVSFNLLNERFYQISSPDCRLDGCSLMELGGHLSLVHSNKESQVDIWLMKNYGVKDSWNKEFIIQPNIPTIRGRIQPLCQLRNREILIECGKQSLFSYDPESKRFKCINVNTSSLPQFQAIIPHSESIISEIR